MLKWADLLFDSLPQTWARRKRKIAVVTSMRFDTTVAS
jgi:hypothetical protein